MVGAELMAFFLPNTCNLNVIISYLVNIYNTEVDFRGSFFRESFGITLKINSPHTLTHQQT